MSEALEMTAEELIEVMDFFDDWADKYRYIIDLGKKLQPLDESEKTEETRVLGCVSRVWMVGGLDRSTAPPVMRFRADSDAHIVRGLIAVVMILFDGQTPAAIARRDALAFLVRVGLDQHLTQSRSNGLHSMIGRIKELAVRAEATA